MRPEIILIFLLALGLFVMQSVGTWFQLQDYQKAVRRVHKLGNVGIGQKKGVFGQLVLIACDSGGVITGAEVMEGMTILSRFRPWTHLEGRPFVGSHIRDFLADFQQYDKQKRKFYKGFIQATEALEKRLYPEEYEARAASEKEAETAKKEERRVKLPIEMMFPTK